MSKSGNYTNGESKKTSENNYLKLQQSSVIRSSLNDISQLLNTGLNAECLNTCITLIEAGIHPQALAEVITQVRREVTLLKSEP